MNKRLLYYLLQVIRYNGTVDRLTNLGFEYVQIADGIGEAIEQGYVSSDERLLELTEAGIKKIDDLQEKLYEIPSAKWIVPEEESRIEKISKFDIYIPDKENLGF